MSHEYYYVSPALTLIGMRGDTFISLSFLDQILPAEFFNKNFQIFLEVKIDIMGLI